jgi:hypothetical protein
MCSQERKEKQVSFGLEISSGQFQTYEAPNTALKSLKSEIHKQKNLKRLQIFKKKIPFSKACWHFNTVPGFSYMKMSCYFLGGTL